MNAAPDRAHLPSFRVSALQSISTDKWEQRWRRAHRGIRLEMRRDSDLRDERAQVITDLSEHQLDAALVRLFPGEAVSDLSDAPLHSVVLYEEGAAVLLSSEHPLADEPEIDGSLLDEPELRAALLPAPVARDARQKSLVVVPVTGLEPTRVVCVWLRERDAQDVQDFVGILRGRGDRSSRNASD